MTADPASPGFHQRLRQLVAGFAQVTFTGLSLSRGLEALVWPLNDAFGAGRTSIWLYERRARRLELAAQSGVAAGSADDDSWAARGLRLDRAQVLAGPGGRALVAPLRGSRRALGTLVMEGGTIDGADEHYVEAVDSFVRQLAAAIENVILLDEVLRQRRLLEDTFNSLSELVVVTDDALHVVQTNNAFASRVGASGAALMNRPLGDLIGRKMAEWVQSPEALEGTAGGAARPAAPPRFEDERLRGTFHVTLTRLINHDGNPAGRVLVARDITEQTRLEAEQAALRARLAQAQKLASLGQFIAGIAHEMNNPLQGVLGHLELLVATSEAARPLRRELRQIYADGERAAKIVQNLLAFTGSNRITPRRVRLETVISRALASRRAARQRARITVARTRDPKLPPVIGDALLLHQAILNVLINAELAVKDLPAGSRRIDVRTEAIANGAVVLTIHDMGSGVAAEILPQIFDPFFTTRDVGEGSGLGLAITYGIIQEHGGTIRAANAPEGGATFTIELPSAPSA